ncbi:hypothetical protein QAD02_004578 [Eretmocerus hayati]|uniref:Uncharacterized protein n=1 Tax=Eretmocerus hayati TaxID=131215 RepID=A0ACC2NRT9_9HYME|nr:hypothetical protein QAD02_004578 [Eretmocerus hayati]
MALTTTSGVINLNELNFTWVLEDFKKICVEAQDEQAWRSPDYRLDDSKVCYLVLKPRSFDAVVSLYILNSNSQEVNRMVMDQHVYSLGNGFGYEKFIERSQFFSESTLLKGGNLHIGCRMYINSTMIRGIGNIITLKDSLLVEEVDKFEELLEKHKFSDVTLKVEGKELLVHKSIVASGSPVFEAMFTHPMKESEENSVEIPDITFNVMKELLRFIYAARVKNLDEVADGLLVAAEKYSIENLKMICENHLSDKLSVENVMQFVDLANVHNASFLKKKCMGFINDHVKELVEAPLFDSWDLDSDILKEVFRSVVKSRVS